MFANHLHVDSRGDNALLRSCSGLLAWRGWTIVLAVLVTLSATGCGGETRTPVFPVSGKVSFKGEVPVGAQVVLHPVGTPTVKDVTPSGTVKADGTFRITSYEAEDGAPSGEYIATIEWFKLDAAEGGRGPNVLPAKYAGAASSPVKISVGAGPTEVPPIEITDK